MNRKLLKLLVLVVVILAVAWAVFVLMSDKATAPDSGSKLKKNSGQSDQNGDDQSFNKSQYSIDDPSSPWVIVNKKRPLPSTYQPAGLDNVGVVNLTSDAAAAARELIAEAANAGISLKGISGYRSYSAQQTLYNGYAQKDGQAAADTYSARPGFSEHQTGLAADLGNSDGSCDLQICFSNSPGGKWLAGNAHKFGFVISYPDGKTSITGYQYEPWHIRYVGKELAAELQKTGLTMQEYFGLPAAPAY